jgi:hypothetical protein
MSNLWILQFRRDQQADWLPFGLVHPFDEARGRLDEARVRLSHSEWRLINATTGGLLHDRLTPAGN